MPRLAHSASSVSYRCDRAFAYAYLDHLREPEVDYADVQSGKLRAVFEPKDPAAIRAARKGGYSLISYKQRGAALGKAGHSFAEGWYLGRELDWSSPIGKLVASGAHLLPHPDYCAGKIVEEPIGDVPIKQAPDKPQVALRAHGILWAGYKDLVVSAPDELARLGIRCDAFGRALFDFKFKSDLDKYALTPAELYDDLQANIYATDLFSRWKIDVIPACWVQIETAWLHQRDKTPKAVATTAYIDRDHASEVVARGAERAKHLDTIVSSDTAAMNIDACTDFGGRPGAIGCPYHVTKGGRCNARLSVGKSAQARTKEGKHIMVGISPELQAQFEARQKARQAQEQGAAASAPPPPAAAPKAPRTRPAAPSPAAAPADAAPAASAPPLPPAAAPRKRRAPAPAEAPAPDAAPVASAPASGTKAARLQALAAKLAEQEAAVAETLNAIAAEVMS